MTYSTDKGTEAGCEDIQGCGSVSPRDQKVAAAEPRFLSPESEVRQRWEHGEGWEKLSLVSTHGSMGKVG